MVLEAPGHPGFPSVQMTLAEENQMGTQHPLPLRLPAPCGLQERLQTAIAIWAPPQPSLRPLGPRRCPGAPSAFPVWPPTSSSDSSVLHLHQLLPALGVTPSTVFSCCHCAHLPDRALGFLPIPASLQRWGLWCPAPAGGRPGRQQTRCSVAQKEVCHLRMSAPGST